MAVQAKRHGAPAAGLAGPRPAIWAALRTGNVLSLRDAAGIGHCDKGSARTFLRALIAGGIVEKLSDNPFAVRIIAESDPGPAVPRLREDGSLVVAGGDRQKIWRAARVLKTFDLIALCAAAEVDPENARNYLGYLVKAGYFAMDYDHKTRRPAVYTAIPSAYTGPLAPQVARIKTVWDPNLGRVVWPADPEGGAA